VAIFTTLAAASIAAPESAAAQKPGEGKISLGQRTLILPAPVWIICSYDSSGRPNAMTASWAGICSSDPASVTVSLRESRYSFDGIVARKAFTVNIPSTRFAAEAAFFGTASGRDVDKFRATGLTAVPSGLVDAPYIGEFPLVVECRLSGTYNVGSHVMLIGEIVDVKADKSVLDGRGVPDMAKVDPFVFATGSGNFHSIGGSLGSVSELRDKIGK
jgi:flavin reductase (DIM6/NTAB) family NADH-FMN oxidoreductase RutF